MASLLWSLIFTSKYLLCLRTQVPYLCLSLVVPFVLTSVKAASLIFLFSAGKGFLCHFSLFLLIQVFCTPCDFFLSQPYPVALISLHSGFPSTDTHVPSLNLITVWFVCSLGSSSVSTIVYKVTNNKHSKFPPLKKKRVFTYLWRHRSHSLVSFRDPCWRHFVEGNSLKLVTF